MTLFKRLLNFYIQSSIHVGLAILSLVLVTAFENDSCPHITYPCCVFFGAILGYNFLKYFEIYQQRKFYKLKYYYIILVSLLAFIGFYFFFRQLINSTQIQLLIAGIFVLGYLFLRKYGVLKMFFVAFVVAYLTAFVFLNPFPSFKGSALLEFAKRFFILSAMMIPFEIYDSQHDAQTLNTLPQKYGIGISKKAGYLLLFFFVVSDVLSWYFNANFEMNFLIVDIIIVVLTILAIYFSSTERNQYYTSFWVESIPILWWALLLLFS